MSAGNSRLSQFSVLSPETLSEATQLLAEIESPVTILAGGTGLIPEWESGKRPRQGWVLDLSRLEPLRVLKDAGDEIMMGAGIRIGEIAGSELLAESAPILVTAARAFGQPIVANRATVGGNVMTSSDCGDLATALLAAGATGILESTEGPRRVPLFSLLVRRGETAAKPGEILTNFAIPKIREGEYSTFRRVGREGLTKVAFAAVAAPSEKGIDVRLALGGVAGTPTRLREMERLLKLGHLHRGDVVAIIRGLDGEITPVDDLLSSARYRRTIAARLLGAFVGELKATGI